MCFELWMPSILPLPLKRALIVRKMSCDCLFQINCVPGLSDWATRCMHAKRANAMKANSRESRNEHETSPGRKRSNFTWRKLSNIFACLTKRNNPPMIAGSRDYEIINECPMHKTISPQWNQWEISEKNLVMIHSYRLNHSIAAKYK